MDAQNPLNLLALPEDVLSAIFAALGATPHARGVVEGLSPSLAPALSLAAAHPALAAALRASLHSISLTFSLGAAVSQAAPLLRLTGPELRSLSLSGPHSVPPAAARALLTLRPGLRSLNATSVTGVDDRVWASLLSVQAPSLSELTVSHVATFGAGAAAALAGVARLESVTLEALPALQPQHVDTVLRKQGRSLRRLAVRLHFPVASLVAARCSQLEGLALGAEGSPSAVVSACVANARTLVATVLSGRPVLREAHVREIVARCASLSEFFAPALPPSVLAHVVGPRLRRLELRVGAVSAVDVAALALRCTRVSHILLDAPRGQNVQQGDAEFVASFVRLVRGLGPALESLCIMNVPAVDDAALGAIGEGAGRLQCLTVDGLEAVSADGIEKIVQANGESLRRVAIGAKCKRISNVSIMRILGKWCPGLSCVSFPRWNLLSRNPREACLDSAVAKFRKSVPNVTIVVG